jgi:hypothetical protein
MTSATAPPSGRPKPYRAEREFGWIVGGILLALGSWWVYRGKFEQARPIFIGVGALLVVLGTLLPKLLRWPNRGWLVLGEALSKVMTTLILGIVYFVVLTPIGLVLRLRGWDPLQRRTAPQASYWHPYSSRQRDPKHFEKMY